MLALRAFWRWWTDTWRTPGRARVLYAAMAFGFAGLTAGAIVAGDELVASIAGALAILTLGLTLLVGRLSRWTRGMPLE